MIPILVLLALFILLLSLFGLSLKVGVQIKYAEQLLVRVKAGPLMLRVFPFPKRKGKKADSDKEKKPKKKKTKKAKRRITFEAVRQVIIECIDPLLDSAGRVRRGLRIHRMTLHLTLGGEADPAAAAQRYGQLNAAAWPLLAALEQIITVENRDVRWNIDFSAPRSHCEGELCLTMRTHHLVRIAAWNGIRFLRALLHFLKATKPDKTQENAGIEQDEENGKATGKGR